MKPHHYSCAGQVVARAKNLPSCGGDVMPRTRLRFRRAIIAFSLAALGMAGVDAVSPAFSQTPPPSVTLKVEEDRKSTRLNSSHGYISYAVFCLKKKKKQN